MIDLISLTSRGVVVRRFAVNQTHDANALQQISQRILGTASIGAVKELVESIIERDAAYAFAKITCVPAAGTDRHRQVLVLSPDPNQPPPVQEQIIGQLMLRDASQVALFKREDGLFRVEGQPIGTDFATGPEPVSLTPQALEGSSVNPMSTMVKLIEQSRSFEHQVRMVKEAKSNDESGASMMRVT